MNNVKTDKAIGFIKSRKARAKVNEYSDRLAESAAKQDIEMLFVLVDAGGSRDLDRPVLDEIYEMMADSELSHVFLRSTLDISDNLSDVLAFIEYANDHNVLVHVVKVHDEDEYPGDFGVDDDMGDDWGEDGSDIWDGGAGC
ncbi:MAG: recombinase family protein [Oscillospiraceae bacterium]|nr:recombinase family protein [Oscillospiraceae bacterium]